MKTAEELNLEYTWICANDPAVHGQLLPNPQNIRFIQSVLLEGMKEGMRRAAKMLRSTKGDGELYDMISARIIAAAEQLTEKDL